MHLAAYQAICPATVRVHIYEKEFTLCSHVLRRNLSLTCQAHGEKNRWTSPQLDEQVGALQHSADIKTALAPLRVRFLVILCRHDVLWQDGD